MHQFNGYEVEQYEGRLNTIHELFGHFGKESYIEPPFRCDYGYNISWGDDHLPIII